MRHWPKHGLLQVWHGKKVLVIERRDGNLQVALYAPGVWEGELETEAFRNKQPRRLPASGLLP